MPRAGADGAPANVSVIVPVTERPANLVQLYRDYSAPLRTAGIEFEFIFVAEPWNHDRLQGLESLLKEREPVTVLETGQTVGEASLTKLGARNARGDVIVTLPAYYRIEPAALPRLIREVEEGADLAVARRWPRRDPYLNRLQTRVFHWIVRRFGRSRLDDVACGVRAMRREVLDTVPLYGDFFRFFPLLAVQEGFDVRQLDAAQHPYDRKTRIYGPGVYLRRVIDLLGVFFLLRFSYKPLRFFGLFGTVFSLAGLAILAILLVQRLGGQAIADRPLLLLGVLLVTIGVQAVALGLIGEIIVHLSATDRRTYRVRGGEDATT